MSIATDLAVARGERSSRTTPISIGRAACAPTAVQILPPRASPLGDSRAAWAIYSFAIPESIVMFAFVPLWLIMVPVPVWVMFLRANFQLVRNAMGHAGFELRAPGGCPSPLTRWINTTTHHDLHHSGSFNRITGFILHGGTS